MKTIVLPLIALYLLLLSDPVGAAKKLAKVQRGTTYKEKQEVHIIVNSIG